MPTFGTFVLGDAVNTGRPGVFAYIYGLRLADETEYRYVGQTRQALGNRLYQHAWTSSRRVPVNLPLYHWIRKHGTQNIVADVLITLPSDDLDAINNHEIAFIASLLRQATASSISLMVEVRLSLLRSPMSSERLNLPGCPVRIIPVTAPPGALSCAHVLSRPCPISLEPRALGTESRLRPRHARRFRRTMQMSRGRRTRTGRSSHPPNPRRSAVPGTTLGRRNVTQRLHRP